MRIHRADLGHDQLTYDADIPPIVANVAASPTVYLESPKPVGAIGFGESRLDQSTRPMFVRDFLPTLATARSAGGEYPGVLA